MPTKARVLKVAQYVAIGAGVYVAFSLLLRILFAPPEAPDAGSRKQVARAVTESLGEAGEVADPEVAFVRRPTHLLVQVLTAAFRTVPEEALTAQAAAIAKTALSNYDRAEQLDSITVLYRERAREGVWWIRHTRSFSVDSLTGLR